MWIRTGSISGNGITMTGYIARLSQSRQAGFGPLAGSEPSHHIRSIGGLTMAQTDNPFLDGMARIFTDAAGAANTLKTEVETFVRQRMEKMVADMDFVPREEFEAVKAMAAKAREQNESLEARIAALEA